MSDMKDPAAPHLQEYLYSHLPAREGDSGLALKHFKVPVVELWIQGVQKPYVLRKPGD